jgi:hypothetical protein
LRITTVFGFSKLAAGISGTAKAGIVGFLWAAAKDFSFPIRAISPQSIVGSSFWDGIDCFGCCAGFCIGAAEGTGERSGLIVNRRSRAVNPVDMG